MAVILRTEGLNKTYRLGTFGALYELEQAGMLGIPFYYVGYWIPGCGTMEYKSSFRPNEVLHPDGVWRPNGRHELQAPDANGVG